VGGGAVRGVIGACAVLLLPVAAVGQVVFDTTPLFRQDAWAVEHTYNPDSGLSWCSADTANGAGQMFSITAYDHGGAVALVIDRAWTFAAEAVRFRIEVDTIRWTVEGLAQDMAVSMDLDEDAEAARFLGDLAAGRALAVATEAGREIAVFSLAGSEPALRALVECWARILRAGPLGAPGEAGGGGDTL
jgi:hypothetical protein